MQLHAVLSVIGCVVVGDAFFPGALHCETLVVDPGQYVLAQYQ